jgi:hypothetical protein
LPVSCDVQKRLYRPGYFIQKGSSLPVRPYLPGKYISENLLKNNITDSSPTAFNSENSPWLNSISSKPIIEKAKSSQQIYIEKEEPRINGILSEAHQNKVVVLPGKVNDKAKRDGSNTQTALVNEKVGSIPGPVRNKVYENLILAFLAGAGSVLLFLAMRGGIRKYKSYNFNEPDNLNSGATRANGAEKTKEEINNIADRLDRCADRFANAKNERVELAARKVAFAIKECKDLGKAKQLEKAFNDAYLSTSHDSDMQHLKLNNLLSNDASYIGTLKPDVVTTTGGYYVNSAGSLSWTMGEPISETVSDTKNTLTEGFQQGSYSLVSVVDESAQPTINISVYPNPVTSLLNIKSDSGDPFRAEVIDLMGNIIYELAFENGQGQINISNLSDAMYLLGIFDKNGNRIKVFKIQKVD